MNLPLLITILYLGCMLLIGIHKYKTSNNSSIEEYFVAGRKLTLWFNTNTMAATAIGAGTTMGIAGMAYSSGIAASWILIGFSIGFSLIAILIGTKIYRLRAITLPDVIESKFDLRTRSLSTILVVIQYIGIGAAQLMALGILAATLLNISFQVAIVLTGGIMIAYTVLGGLFAVALTDVVQMILNAIGIMIVIPFLGLKAVGGLVGLQSKLPGGHFDMMSLGFGVIIGFLAWIIPQGFLSQELWIRIFAAKDEKVGKAATLIASIGVYIPYMISVVVIGLAGAALYPGIKPDSVLPHMIKSLTHPFLQGILFSSLIAAVMSCADSVLLVAASNIVKDVYLRYINPEASPGQIISVSRLSVLIIGIFSIIVAIYAKGILTLMENMATPFVGGLFPTVLALFFWPKVTSEGATAAIIASMIVAAILFLTKVQIFGLHPIVITIIVSTITLIFVSMMTYNTSKTTKKLTI